jgi:hypothetical protein
MRRILAIMVLVLSTSSIQAQSNTPDVLIQVAVDNPNPFVGQPIKYSIQVSTVSTDLQPELIYPDFSGFGRENIQELPVSNRVINDRVYTVFGQEIILYPNQEDAIAINPTVIRVPETPFQAEASLQSTEIEVIVRPLPEPEPVSFNNAIGTFSLSANLSAETIAFGDVATLTILLTGNGNIKTALFPSLNLSDTEWRIFERSSQFNGETPINGTQIFTWTLIPKISGTLNIPAFEFTFFNPTTQNFETLQTTPLSLVVAGEGETSIIQATPRPNVSINSLMPLSGVTYQPIVLTPHPIFWLIAPVLVFGVWIFTMMRKNPRPVTQNRPQISQDNLLSKLKQINSAQPQVAHAQVARLLKQHLQLSAQKQNISVEDWLNNLPSEQQKRLKVLISQAEGGNYAPVTPQDAQLLIKQTSLVIQALETNRNKS